MFVAVPAGITTVVDALLVAPTASAGTLRLPRKMSFPSRERFVDR